MHSALLLQELRLVTTAAKPKLDNLARLTSWIPPAILKEVDEPRESKHSASVFLLL